MPKVKKTRDNKNKLDSAVIVALIALLGTLFTAFFSSPVLIALIQQTPVSVILMSSPQPSETLRVFTNTTPSAAIPTQTNLKIIESLDHMYIFVTGCRNSEGSYYLTQTTHYEMTITNQGLRPASLVKIDFYEEQKDYKYKTFVLESSSILEHNSSDTILRLPIDIGAGVARKWFLAANRETFYQTKETMLNASSEMQSLHSSATWKLLFSDESILTRDVPVVFYSANPSLADKDISCN